MGDDDIRAALRRGDIDAAFEWLMERYEDAIFDRAVAVLRDDALSEDAVQATMMKALRTRDGLDHVHNLPAWLMQVAHNAALDIWRGRKRHKGRIERMRQRGGADLVIDEVRADDEDSERDHAALRDCLGELEPDTRAALLRRHRDEAGWDEIAREVNLAAEAVRMRVKRAMQRLRRCLERQEVAR